MLYKLFIFCFFFSPVFLYSEDLSSVKSSIEPLKLENIVDETSDLNVKNISDDAIADEKNNDQNGEAIGITDPFIIAAALGDIVEFQRIMTTEGKAVNYAEPVLGLTPLIVAVAQSNEAMFAFLLAQPDININCVMKEGLTPLHCAVLQNDLKMVKLLLAAPGIDVKILDNNGMSAETMASMGNFTACLQLFEEHKAL